MKTKILLSLFISCCVSFCALSQSRIDEMLQSIERNNTTLEALRQTAEAHKIENRSGIYLSDPEVEFGYFWGKPGQIGNRTDISATQSFDIAVIGGMKSRLADNQNLSVEWQLKTERMNILLEAKLLCIDLIYYNSMRSELETRLAHARSIADVYEKRLEHGDANRLEYNKSQLNLVNAQSALSKIEVERNSVLSELKRLNGGVEFSFSSAEFEPLLLPASFDDWYEVAEQKSPVLAYIRQEVEVSKSYLAVNRAERLPKFFAGYMSEKLVGEHFQGVSVGVTIPLWENKNRVAQAKATVRASEARELDGKHQFYVTMKNRYDRAFGLQSLAQDYRNLISTSNSSELLKKALDAGEISLLDYLLELGMYYDTVDLALEAEHDYQKAVAELMVVEL